jgi:hypothetical protein
MGLEMSREFEVDIEEETKNRTLKFWEQKNYEILVQKDFEPNSGTLTDECILKAFEQDLIDVLFPDNQKPENFEILDIGSGNGWHVKNIMEKYPFLNITATDYFIPETHYRPILKFLSHEAVKEFEGKFNALMFISPPPMLYVDYYAIKEYELQKSDQKKIIIYIGELGASDGGEGMYLYMLENSYWKLVHRKEIDVGTDFMGGKVVKEIFVFTN